MKIKTLIMSLLLGASVAYGATENAQLLSLKAERLSVLELIKENNKKLISSEFKLKRIKAEGSNSKVAKNNIKLTELGIKMAKDELAQLKDMNQTLTAKIVKAEKSAK